ncbi:hypothetical protein [Corynebacterium freiburgense]|uniref:hypothetical protein n=1 Tax=Corynebacterium freiburgense TaxID=556548 RepID=UPI0003F9A142|nr:hypothetical protein [Corynebacterium freiburgense]WJZ01747.1 hypothetical protein CFREI_02215 [Corynebacterium freiburgense]
MNNLRGVEDSGAEEYQDELVLADDAFLDDLARGLDPSDGSDELAGLLLGLKAEVDAPMPPAPVLSDAPTTMMPPLRDVVLDRENPPAPTTELEFEDSENSEEVAEVIDLSSRRKKRSFRQAFIHGVLGAAAATLAIAGSGIVIYNAGPESPLWPAHVALFNDHAAVVELASTLEQADDLRARGEVERALELLDEARTMAADMQAKRNSENASAATTVTVTQQPTSTHSTSTEMPEEPAPAPAPPPVTVTTTVTIVPQPAPSSPQPQPSQPTGSDNPNPSPVEPAQPSPVDPAPPGDNSGG